MTNFVLTGLPDFIVVGLPWQPSRPQPGGEPVHVDSDFAEVLSLLGASCKSDELSNQIDCSEAGYRALRRVLDRFGFERLPDNFAELYGLLDYCDRLTAISGIGVVHESELGAWQAKSFLLLSEGQTSFRSAAELFRAGDLQGLRAWHRSPDAMLDLGRAYRKLA